MKWGNLKFGPWPADSMVMTIAGVAVVLYIGIVQLAVTVPAAAVCGGVTAGAVMMYLNDSGSAWLSLAGPDRLRFAAIVVATFIVVTWLTSVLESSQR